jgi:hypothetical protein
LTQTTTIQAQINENEEKLRSSHLSFKQEVQIELDEFRALLAQQQIWIESKLTENTPSLQHSPPVVTSMSTAPQLTPSLPMVSQSTSSDLQTQMLLMITDILVNFPWP